ncbi:hypothetical protein ACHQM5_007166 [Ranunculus cassubicifolius]
MEKVLLILLLIVLVISHGLADKNLYDEMFMPDEFEGLHTGDELEEEFLETPHWTSQHSSKLLVNVDGFGAIGDGVADDTQAFLKAWDKACNASKAVLLVPEKRRYLLKPATFKGPCADRLIIQIDGTIVAPDDPENWDPENPRTWLRFTKLNGVSFQGAGVIDGSGKKWWDSSCKRNKSNPCREAPTALTIQSSSAVRVKGLTIRNSQQMHFVISSSDSVRVLNVKVSAPETSPNTDGIHITKSTNVVLQDCKIGTGDDCISIVNGSSGIKMKNIFCGPGHGISIGSLGVNNSTGIVSKIVVDTAYLKETTNGLRIKTYQGGSGYVRAVRFENIRVENIQNPIIIDQFYCDSSKPCQNQTSAVKISQIMYRNISGTTKSAKAMKFACSDTVPCSSIVLSNINLEKEDGTAETYCNSVTGFGYGYVHPSADCLQSSSDKDIHSEQKDDMDIVRLDRDTPLHTEL